MTDMNAAWNVVEKALIAAQGDDDGFSVDIGYWDEFPDEPWSVSAADIQVIARTLPQALLQLAALVAAEREPVA